MRLRGWWGRFDEGGGAAATAKVFGGSGSGHGVYRGDILTTNCGSRQLQADGSQRETLSRHHEKNYVRDMHNRSPSNS